jgi:prepilin-type N-terminal cleavage/methylation domain-containing protein
VLSLGADGKPGGEALDAESGRGSNDPRVPRAAFAQGTGFTLVEILVTLAVIAIAIGAISLTFGHDGAAQMRQESDRLRSALEHAAQLAQWRRTDLVWQADDAGYRFLRPGGLWQVVEEGDEILPPTGLPARPGARGSAPPAAHPVATDTARFGPQRPVHAGARFAGRELDDHRRSAQPRPRVA